MGVFSNYRLPRRIFFGGVKNWYVKMAKIWCTFKCFFTTFLLKSRVNCHFCKKSTTLSKIMYRFCKSCLEIQCFSPGTFVQTDLFSKKTGTQKVPISVKLRTRLQGGYRSKTCLELTCDIFMYLRKLAILSLASPPVNEYV